MRLIDANELAKKAYEVAYPIIHGNNDHERGLTLMGLAQLLDEQPTVDAVEVIRCKDCKHARYDSVYDMCWCDGKELQYADHYCSYGERK